MYNTLYSDRILQKQRLAKSMKKCLTPTHRRMRFPLPRESGLRDKIAKPCLLFGDLIPTLTVRIHDNSPTPAERKKPICCAMPPTAQQSITQDEKEDVKIIHQEAAFPILSSQTPALSYKSSQWGSFKKPPPPPTFCVPPTPPPTPSLGPPLPSSFPPPPPPSTPPPSPPLHPVVSNKEEAPDTEDMRTTPSRSYHGRSSKTLPLELPECITSTVLQLFKTKATRDMDPNLAMQLSQQYPHGFFEAVEALTFVSQSSWWTPLMMEITNPYFHNLWDTITYAYVRQKVTGGVVNPPSRTFLFAPFNCTPLHKVKVVIPALGPTSGQRFQSDGLAYSVLPQGGNLPLFGLNLFQLLKQLQPDFVQPPHASLKKWAEQGVFLFNLSLVSVNTSKVCSQNYGMIFSFKDFSAGVAKILDENCGHLVFLVFETSNNDHLRKLFLDFLSPGKHTIIEGPCLRRTCSSKNQANCFKRVNTELEKLGKTPIDWTAL